MRRAATLATGFLAGFLCSYAFAGESLSGRPQILDGDTLRLRGTIVGLYGIAAPGPTQSCEGRKGERVACGERATQALAERVGTASITCEPRGFDTYRRTLAVCRFGDEDLAAWMVAQGFAVADRLRARDYITQDAQAWAKRIGLWASVFEDPSDRMREDYQATLKLSAVER